MWVCLYMKGMNVFACAVAAVAMMACGNSGAGGSDGSGAGNSDGAGASGAGSGAVGAGAGGGGGAAVAVPVFDADSAYGYVRMQTECGPRTPGSAAHGRVADRLARMLWAFGADTVIEQRATVRQVGGKDLPVRNIMGRFGADKDRRLLLLAHYDTRPWADEDADAANHTRPIDGANDGASGVAVLLELARAIGSQNPAVGVDILMVDTEDSGIDAPEGSDMATQRMYESTWCLGSQHFARNLPYTQANRPQGAILLDMVGGRDAVFNQEYYSQQFAPALTRTIWDTARAAGYGDRFPTQLGGAVNDDHLPLNGAGIPTVDIIEIGHPATGSFNPTWHTMNDNIDNIDTATLKAVGQTVMTVIYNF